MALLEQLFPDTFSFLNNLCDQSNPDSSRAMARNLLVDHRVSEPRLRAFLAGGNSPMSLGDLNLAINSYQQKEVRVPIRSTKQPAYARYDNFANSVDLSRETSLGTILDLTRLGPIYAEARLRFGLEEFTGLGTETTPAAINAFLQPRLENTALRPAFMRALLKARSLYLKKVEPKVNPTWSAEWTNLQPFLVPGSPRRWLEAVGVAKETPRWLAVIRYPVANRDRVLTMFRPTQLDAGWYPHHFPSPPDAPTERGGFTMFLGDAPAKYGLVSEYIHPEIHFSFEEWESGGSLVGVTSGPVGAKLADRRVRHHQLLEREFGSSVLEWMPDCF